MNTSHGLNLRRPAAVLIATLIASFSVLAETQIWDSADDFPEKCELKPGDRVVIRGGEYKDVSVQFTGGGTEDNRAYVYAEPLGSARFIGSANLELAGEYITLAGLTFDGRPADFDPTESNQITTRDTGPAQDERSLGGPLKNGGPVMFIENSRHCRLTNTFFANFDRNYDGYEKGLNYIMLRGFENEIDHCHFEHKRSKNVVIFIKPDPKKEPGPKVRRNHSLHHNYFGERNYIARNGWETIRIADSKKQEFEMACKIDHNYFFRSLVNPGSLAVEKEILSNKSRKNEYTNNVFEECDGQLTLRHGRDCLVENNWFLGNRSVGATGVRVIGSGHVVRNNLFYELGGEGYCSSFVTMLGGYGIVNNQYEGVENIVLEGNKFINCAQPISLGFDNKRGEEYDDPPRNLTIKNNQVLSDGDEFNMFRMSSDMTTTGEWSGNIYYNTKTQDHYGDIPAKGWEKKEFTFELGTPPVTREMTGPSFAGGPADSFVVPAE